MIGFTKEEILQKTAQWIADNEQWMDTEMRKALQNATSQADAFDKAMVFNLRVIVPNAIASLLETQNKLMTKQIEEMIDKKIGK